MAFCYQACWKGQSEFLKLFDFYFPSFFGFVVYAYAKWINFLECRRKGWNQDERIIF